MPFEIRANAKTDGPPLGSLERWFEEAPPAAGLRHWRAGRSAQELAKAFCAGTLPLELTETLSLHPCFGNFAATSGQAELRTAFDALGEPRHHDLVLHGLCGDVPALLDIEAKADEEFNKKLSDALCMAGSDNARRRIHGLAKEVLDLTPDHEDARKIRYQLLYGLAATVARARLSGAKRALFLVLVFRNETCQWSNLRRNDGDLEVFAQVLGIHDRREGPHGWVADVKPRNAFAADVLLSLGKVVIHQSEPKGRR